MQPRLKLKLLLLLLFQLSQIHQTDFVRVPNRYVTVVGTLTFNSWTWRDLVVHLYSICRVISSRFPWASMTGCLPTPLSKVSLELKIITIDFWNKICVIGNINSTIICKGLFLLRIKNVDVVIETFIIYLKILKL